MGNDPFVDVAESASFPLPLTGKREGGEKMQPLHRFWSHLGTNFSDFHPVCVVLFGLFGKSYEGLLGQ